MGAELRLMRPWHACLVIFTDLDGTLLDPVTYSWEAAKPAMEACARMEIPVILNSSKTGAEMAHLARQMAIAWPYIVENGGGICFPEESAFQCMEDGAPGRSLDHVSFGVAYGRLCESLLRISAETGAEIRGFSQMSPDDVMALTGLDRKGAERAMQRQYDEPFLIDPAFPGSLDRIRKAAARLGLQVTPGGRFYHLHGAFDKGKAVEWLSARLEPFGQICKVGIGDSDNDIPMLQAVDIPVWVAPPEKPAPAIDGLLRSTEAFSGPTAWNQVVLSLIRERYSR
ncbi:HAD-IIB family hydrolase [Desulfatirhabdium butyrativorans]|uniref:HAD-IIB family hydrolase n=1 Tax=Desulfatirhabdium butyrativorans TaxID=340467 RepID=UPI0004015EA5|nr:HAD-IIB family hydrolase [Desulfatirhabdium butyrativorans]